MTNVPHNGSPIEAKPPITMADIDKAHLGRYRVPVAAGESQKFERLDLDPQSLHTPPDNPEPTMEEVQVLLPSIEKLGQLVDVIVYPHEELPGDWWVADGNYRVFCLKALGRSVRAIALPKAPTQDELITLRVTTQTACKQADKGLIGCDIWTWMNLTSPPRTQTQAAEHFSLSAGYINKLVTPYMNGIDELIEALKCRRIAPTSASFVASLPAEQQREILPRVLGKKRAAVKAIRDAYKPSRSGGCRAKPLKVTVCGITLATREPQDRRLACLRELRDRLTDVLKQVEKDPRLVQMLPALLAG